MWAIHAAIERTIASAFKVSPSVDEEGTLCLKQLAQYAQGFGYVALWDEVI